MKGRYNIFSVYNLSPTTVAGSHLEYANSLRCPRCQIEDQRVHKMATKIVLYWLVTNMLNVETL